MTINLCRTSQSVLACVLAVTIATEQSYRHCMDFFSRAKLCSHHRAVLEEHEQTLTPLLRLLTLQL